MKAFLRKIVEILSMQKPRDRLALFATLPLLLWAISNMSFLPTISLYSYLDIPSPSIGLTRSFWRLLSGDLVGAWNQNLLIYPAVLVALTIIIKDLHTVFRKR